MRLLFKIKQNNNMIKIYFIEIVLGSYPDELGVVLNQTWALSDPSRPEGRPRQACRDVDLQGVLDRGAPQDNARPTMFDLRVTRIRKIFLPD